MTKYIFTLKIYQNQNTSFWINEREQAGIKNLNDPHAFIEYSNDMDDVLDDINIIIKIEIKKY